MGAFCNFAFGCVFVLSALCGRRITIGALRSNLNKQQNKFFCIISAIGRLLGTDYRPTNNWPVPYRCNSNLEHGHPGIGLHVTAPKKLTVYYYYYYHHYCHTKYVLTYRQRTLGRMTKIHNAFLPPATEINRNVNYKQNKTL